MKTNYFAQVTFAAALAVAGSFTAFAAEGSHAKASVNFPFRVSTVDMPAGKYDLVQRNGNAGPRFYLRETTSHKQIMVASWVTAPAKSNAASMTFRCSASNCGLVEIAIGDGRVYKTQSPKYTRSESERLVTVNLDRVAGE